MVADERNLEPHVVAKVNLVEKDPKQLIRLQKL